MKNIKIRARWFNIGSLLTTAFFFYIMCLMEKEEQIDEITKNDENKTETSQKFNEIIKYYEEKRK